MSREPGRFERGDRDDDLDADRSAEDLEADGLDDSPVCIFEADLAFQPDRNSMGNDHE